MSDLTERIYEAHLSGWIIQDGNYDDFEFGEHRRFAIEYWPVDELAVSEATSKISPKIDRVEPAIYDAVGTVSFVSERWHVIDVGLLAYSESTPRIFGSPGVSFTGRLGLGVDPFFFTEYLHRDAGAPPLVYTWRIESIELITTPRVLAKMNGSDVWIRDPTRPSSENVQQTDAWKDQDGDSEYILHCRLLDADPILKAVQP